VSGGQSYRDVYCPKCGYNLRQLTENRCPECGSTFDLRQVRAVQRIGITRRSVILQLLLAPAGFALVFFFCVCAGGSAVFEPVGLILTLLFVLLMTILHTTPLARACVRTYQLKHRGNPLPWYYQAVWPLAVLFAMIETVLVWVYSVGIAILLAILVSLL